MTDCGTRVDRVERLRAAVATFGFMRLDFG